MEELCDPTCFSCLQANIALDTLNRWPLGQRVFEVRRALPEVSGMRLRELHGRVAVGDVPREQSTFTCKGVDRLAILHERVAIDGAAVATGERDACEQKEDLPHSRMISRGCHF
jgi:hypothetical protein